MMGKKQKTPAPPEASLDALIPEAEQPYKVPENWVWVRLECVAKWAGFSVWQKSFHDHVIHPGGLLSRLRWDSPCRNEEDYYRIAEYIENNPTKWADDCYYEG